MFRETVTFNDVLGPFDIETKYGNKTKTIFVEDGGQERRFEFWKPTLAQQITLGVPVDLGFVTKVNGEYTNYDVKQIYDVTDNDVAGNGASPAPVANPAPQVAAPEGSPFQDKQRMINRSAAVGRAVDIFSLAGVDPLGELDGVIELATKLADFIDTGEYAYQDETQIVAIPSV